MKSRTLVLAALPLVLATSAAARTKTSAQLASAEIRKDYALRQPSDRETANQLMVRGKFAAAANYYRKQLNRNPKDIAALNGLGMALGKQFKLDSADEQFDKVLNLDTNNALAHSGKSMVLLRRLQSSSVSYTSKRQDILQKAEAQSKLAIAAQSNLPEAHYSLALVYKEQGKLNDAAVELQKAIKLDPDFSEAYSELGTIDLAQSNSDAALANFKKALAINSGNSAAHYGLGRWYIKQDLLSEAIKELNISLYQNTNSAPAHEALGAAYELQGNNVAAIREYQEAIRVKPENAQAYVRIAQIREKRGDIEHSIAELRAGTEIIPDNAPMHIWIAKQSLRTGKLDDALVSYGKALQLDPTSAEAAVGWSRAYFLKWQKHSSQILPDLSDIQQQEELLEKLVAANPDNLELALAEEKIRALSGKEVKGTVLRPAKSDDERVAYVELLLAKNDLEQSKKEMTTLVENAKTIDDALQAAETCALFHDLDNAGKAYRKAFDLGARDRANRGLKAVDRSKQLASAYKSEADELTDHKSYDKAIEKYESALFENPYLSTAHLALARTLENCNRTATSYLQEASLHYLAYLATDSNLSDKDRSKIQKHVDALRSKETKLAERKKN
jgi:tetratricopeptide (TPR) repeat protein